MLYLTFLTAYKVVYALVSSRVDDDDDDDDDDEQHLYGAIYLFQITFKGASSSNKISN